MSFATASTVSEILERKYAKFKRYFLQRRRILSVLHPIACLASILGISGVSVKRRGGRYTAKPSSELTVMYSYVILAYGIFYDTAALYYYYTEYPDAIMILYLATRAALAAAIHLSWLLKRKDVSKLLQMKQDFGARIPAYLVALPIINSILIILTSLISANFFGNRTAVILQLVGNLRSPIFIVYGCFKCIVHAAFFKDSLNVIHSKIQNFGKTPAKYQTLRPIMKECAMLRQLCCSLTHTEGALVLLTSVAVCEEIVYCLFLSCMANDIIAVAVCLIWSVLHMVPGISATLAWQQVESTFKKTTAVVKELQLRNSFFTEISVRKEEFGSQAQELQIQLKQMPLSFGPSGWFVLNGDQLQTAVASVITYSVILIQNIDLRVEQLLLKLTNTYEEQASAAGSTQLSFEETSLEASG